VLNYFKIKEIIFMELSGVKLTFGNDGNQIIIITEAKNRN